MKKFTASLFALVLLHAVSAQKTYEGTWQGKLTFPGGALRLVVNLKNAAGTYLATMDSPDQGAKGIPADNVRITGDSLLLDIASVGGKLSGRFTSDTTFSGEWFQGTAIPLNLKKLGAHETVAEAKRLQTPKPPFPYRSEDVVYNNHEKSVQYGATITSPRGAGPFPAVVFITGSGQQNRDEELFGHRPFAVLADYLTRKGYVVLRVDDRGVGQTTGDVKNATSKDFAADVMAGLDYLKAMPQVAKNKLGLLGHSEGGMIAQIVAAERSDVDFVVMLAGPGQRILDLMAEQNRAILEKTGLVPAAVRSYGELYKAIASAVVYAPTDTAAKQAALSVVNAWLKKTPKAVIKSTTGIETDSDKNAFINEFVKGLRSTWFDYFMKYNPDTYVQKMKAKVLALNGEK
ncbi:MAG TPA: alpha/beta fold hydrolase, partial [Flavisolibacter sp.]|nr:alpha/beta fold hydrolase [Flavisolibacter sp.]